MPFGIRYRQVTQENPVYAAFRGKDIQAAETALAACGNPKKIVKECVNIAYSRLGEYPMGYQLFKLIEKYFTVLDLSPHRVKPSNFPILQDFIFCASSLFDNNLIAIRNITCVLVRLSRPDKNQKFFQETKRMIADAKQGAIHDTWTFGSQEAIDKAFAPIETAIDTPWSDLDEPSDSSSSALKVADPNIEGLTLINTTPDGNCLFEAITLYLSQHTIDSLRLSVSQYLYGNEKKFREFTNNPENYKKYTDDISDPKLKKWGGQLEIQAMTEIFQRPIIVITSEAPVIPSDLGTYKDAPIFLYYKDFHYSALLMTGDCKAQNILNSLTSKSDTRCGFSP